MTEPKSTNELVATTPSDMASSMIQVIERAAANPAIDVEKMERLLSMQERIMNRQAEMDFNAAMKLVQQSLPSILRTKKNDTTNSRYADLEVINDAIVPIYTGKGFSLSFGTAEGAPTNHYRVTCMVSHDAGHTRHYQCDVPSDLTGMKGTPNKTGTHAFGSTMSYARRYLTLLIFNITLTNEDDDGVAGGAGPRLNEEQIANVNALIDEVAANTVGFLSYMSKAAKVTITTVEEIPAKYYLQAVKVLEDKRKEKKQEKK